MTRKNLLFLTFSFVTLLFIGAFHHHPGGLNYEACSLCYLTSHHSEYSSQTVLLFDPSSGPLEFILASDQTFRPFLAFSFCPGRSPPSFLALS